MEGRIYDDLVVIEMSADERRDILLEALLAALLIALFLLLAG